MFIESLGIVDNFDRLKKEVLDVFESVGKEVFQISCQTMTENSNNLGEGTGSYIDLEVRNELEYKFVPPVFRGSEIEKIINKYSGFRTRLLAMKPRSCYSVHRDVYRRIHIPIITTDQCWMIWPHKNQCHKLDTGFAFLTNTKLPHTFINGHDSVTRIHIVMNVLD